MKRVYLILSICMVFPNLFSQTDSDSVLNLIRNNNLQLKALRKDVEAERTGNRTGINPENPEFGFDYLWGSPVETGNRTDLTLTQTLDFPTAYIYKGQISGIKNEQLDLQYERLEKEIMLKSRLICYDLVYYNARIKEMEKRLEHAMKIASAYQIQYKTGETGILEYNKAELNLVGIRNEISVIQIEKEVLLTELAGLNGNLPLPAEFSQDYYPDIPVSEDFEGWYKEIEVSNPELKRLNKQVELQEKQEQLNLALSLPKFIAGYMRESIAGEDLRGITVGLSIPLWEDRNKMKYARLKTEAVRNYREDMESRVYNRIRILHARLIRLRKEMNEYRKKSKQLVSTDLLLLTLEKGEINLIDYITELKFYYNSTDRLLQMEREVNKTYAELLQFL